MTYVNIDEIRIAGGFPQDLISDSDISHSITIVEDYVERSMNTFFTPVQRIEFLDGTNTEFFYTLKNPVLRVEKLVSNDNDIDMEDIIIERESGKVILKRSADAGTFLGRLRGIRVQYQTAFLIPDKKNKTIQSDVSKGNNVVVSLDFVDTLIVGDWVQIMNIEGTYTSAKITAVNGTDVTLDLLVVDVKSNSTLTKLIIPEYIKRFIELEAVIYLALNAIGATYVFNASYSLGDLSVTKGVPYTHWRESLEKAIKERNTLRNIVKPRFKIM